jgi:hypothetical protein
MWNEYILRLSLFLVSIRSLLDKLADHGKIDAPRLLQALHSDELGHGGPHLPVHLLLILPIIFFLFVSHYDDGCLYVFLGFNKQVLGVPGMEYTEFEEV